jgi:hypothetical protein
VSPELLIYNRIRQVCVNVLGADKVAQSWASGKVYPHVVLGEQFKQNIRVNKDELNRPTQVTLHFWHNNVRQRGTLVNMMYQVEEGLLSEFGVDGDEITTQVAEDTTTSTTFLHGVLEITIEN